MRRLALARLVLPCALVSLACQAPPATRAPPDASAQAPAESLELTSLATNAFWYYQDLDAATHFYTQTLGFELFQVVGPDLTLVVGEFQ